jgi:hypothetical protein
MREQSSTFAFEIGWGKAGKLETRATLRSSVASLGVARTHLNNLVPVRCQLLRAMAATPGSLCDTNGIPKVDTELLFLGLSAQCPTIWCVASNLEIAGRRWD